MRTNVIPAKYREPHYSTRLCRAQYQYIAKYYDKSVYEKVCNELNVPLEYVLRDDNWVSDLFFVDLIGKLKLITGDEDISTKIGIFTVSPEVINPVEYAVNRTLLFPWLLYFGLPIQYSHYNTINKMHVKKKWPGHFVYHVVPVGSITAHPDVCKSTWGMLQSSQRFFELDSLTVEHTKCVHRNDLVCEFEVQYSAKSFWKDKIKKTVTAMGIGTALYMLGLYAIPKSVPYFAYLSGFLVTYLSILFGAVAFSKYLGVLRYVHQYNDQSKSKADELFENYLKLERKYSESNLLRNLSNKLSGSITTRNLLRSCLDELHSTFGYERSLIMLLSGDKKRLYSAETRGFEGAGKEFFNLSVVYPANKDNPQLFANILETGSTKAILKIDTFKQTLKPANQALIETLGVNALIVAPIQDTENKYGLLIIGSVKDDRQLTDDDTNLIDNISKLLSLSFQNASYLENETGLRTLFQKYVPAMVLDGVSATGHASLMPKNANIASMFIDLRDFTSRCENLAPEKVVELLNIYTDYVTSHVSQAGGIIDKLVGDGIHAFFVEDKGQPDSHCKAALHGALAVLGNIADLQTIFLERGYGNAALGIGLHAGRATIGSMGCDRKMDYTALGDTVNLASRLETLSKDYRKATPSAAGATLVMTAQTFKAASIAVKVHEIGQVQIRGRAQSEHLVFIDGDSAREWLNEEEKNAKKAA